MQQIKDLSSTRSRIKILNVASLKRLLLVDLRMNQSNMIALNSIISFMEFVSLSVLASDVDLKLNLSDVFNSNSFISTAEINANKFYGRSTRYCNES